MDGLGNLLGTGGAVAVALLTLLFAAAIALLALWITLPLAVLGVRGALRELVEAQKETNRGLAELLSRAQPAPGRAVPQEPDEARPPSPDP